MIHHPYRSTAALLALLLATATACARQNPPAQTPAATGPTAAAVQASKAASPIQHVVVIFQENVSFDRYFGTYPGVNGFPGGDPNRVTPQANRALPYHATAAEALAHDVPHTVSAMIKEYNDGKMDQYATVGGRYTMGYFDYHEVPGYWLLARRFSLADNYFQPVFGPSTPGALQLVAADNGPIVSDEDPPFGPHSVCAKVSVPGECAKPLTGRNIGDQLSAAGVSWTWYQEGWRSGKGYVAHHNPFMYFQTADPKGGNQYTGHIADTAEFLAAVKSGSLPAVAFVKGGQEGAQGPDGRPVGDNGHAGDSGPNQDDQFVTDMVNTLMAARTWPNTLIVVTFDESGGFYDHVAPPQLSTSAGSRGYGPRIPALFISPFVRPGFVSHQLYDHSAILKFIEWNWQLSALGNQGRRDEHAADMREVLDFNQPPQPAAALPSRLADRAALYEQQAGH